MNVLKIEDEKNESIDVKNAIPRERQRTGSFRCVSADAKKRILIIEDHRPLAEVAAMIFEDVGNVEIADNGSIGLTKVSDTYFGVIGADIEMPVMNGIEFFYQALKVYPNIRERIVFCSGSSQEAHQRFIQKNGLRYVSKPYELEEIRDIVYEIICEIS